MSEHAHPHGIEDVEPHPERLWYCECGATFADEEIRRDAATGEWGHACKGAGGCRCEGHLDPYMPEATS